MTHGLSFKTVNDTNLTNFKAKLAMAIAKGWKPYGDTTKEKDGNLGYCQVLAKNKKVKQNETEPQTA